jgi:hypothetical protein
MTTPPDFVILADHSVLLAIPAFAPAVIVVGVVVYVAMRDRRRSGDEPQSENSDATGQDGAP